MLYKPVFVTRYRNIDGAALLLLLVSVGIIVCSGR